MDGENNVDIGAYRTVFFASPDFVSISRWSDGVYLDVNPGYEKFTGYKRHEVIGKSVLDLDVWPDPDARKDFILALQRDQKLTEYPIQLRTKNGEIKDVEVSATITHIDGERVLIAVVRDVTEKKRAELELVQSRQELERRVLERTAELATANELLRAEIEVRHAAEEKIRHFANHDPLTGLPNRRLLDDRIENALRSARRSNAQVAIQFIDLDRFKEVNDTLGHRIGDLLLQEVAERLRCIVREVDTVSRIGGDEFVILLPDLHSVDQAYAVAKRIFESLAKPYLIEGHSVLSITPSIGVSFYPQDGDNPEDLINHADAAMYTDKQGKKSSTRQDEDSNGELS